jgi:chemotaxis protein MotB
MAALARRRSGAHHDYTWPGYVDALASLLMVLIFLLAFYSMAQVALTDAISGRDVAIERLNRDVAGRDTLIERLNREVSGLADLLSLERDRTRRLDSDLATLALQLKTTTEQRDRAVGELAATSRSLTLTREERDRLAEEARRLGADAQKVTAERDQLTDRITALLAERERLAAALRGAEGKLAETGAAAKRTAEEMKAEVERQRVELTRLAASLAVANNERGKYFADLTEEQKLSAEQKAAVVRLTAEINALKQELARLAVVLDAADVKAREQQAQIADLGQRLNRALAARVEELQRYKSEFFGRMREVLAGRTDITVVGDRFVFQSEVLFETNVADLQPEGERQLAELAESLREIIGMIPPEIDWVLQIDGHTDNRPIRTPRFPSNWELSTARAASVVKFLASQGLPTNRLAAAGYGEYHPIAAGDDRASRARNRRIEIKLTSR